jgi:hypothetical protein
MQALRQVARRQLPQQVAQRHQLQAQRSQVLLREIQRLELLSWAE